jgi:cytochrome c-type biogenesis protein CcmF
MGQMVVPGIAALIAGWLVPVWMGGWTPLTGMGMALAVWLAASGVLQVARRLKSGNPPLSFWGMHFGHFGIAVFVVGVTLVGGFQEEKDVRMEAGDVVTVGGHEFRFLGVKEVAGPNYDASRAEFEVRAGDGKVSTLKPEKRRYFSSSMPMTNASIDAGFTRDVYVSLGEPLDDGRAWAVRVYFKPFVDWIWGGCVLMALGGVLAMSDRRYRLRMKNGGSKSGAVA